MKKLLFLLQMMVFISLSAYGQWSSTKKYYSNGINYTLTTKYDKSGEVISRTAKVTNWDDDIEDLVIPEKVEFKGEYEEESHSYIVTEIDCHYQNNKQLRSLFIPSSVEIIRSASFALNENLETVSIGDDSGGCKQIGDGAFRNCKKLFQVWCYPGVESIGKEAFSKCIALKNLILPSSVKTIGDQAFYKTALETFTFPESVIDVGKEVFMDCENLEQANFNYSLKIISDRMFSGCKKLSN